MNSFQSLSQLFKSTSMIAIVVGLLVIIALLPVFLLLFCIAFVWGIHKHHNRTCRHFAGLDQTTVSMKSLTHRAGSANGKAKSPLKRVNDGPNVNIKLSNGVELADPELRIREYTDIEVYRGYDDRHSTDSTITLDDVAAANELYAMIDRYDRTESSRIIETAVLSSALENLPDSDLMDMDDQAWERLKPSVRNLLQYFLSLRGIGLAKATKILHLKRPHLIPVLDSFVVKFLTGTDPSNEMRKGRLVDLGLEVMNLVRMDLRQNRGSILRIASRLADLPIELTLVRMHDILCWTQEKWVVRGNTHAKYGTASLSV